MTAVRGTLGVEFGGDAVEPLQREVPRLGGVRCKSDEQYER
jgi:hypothetical protein